MAKDSDAASEAQHQMAPTFIYDVWPLLHQARTAYPGSGDLPPSIRRRIAEQKRLTNEAISTQVSKRWRVTRPRETFMGSESQQTCFVVMGYGKKFDYRSGKRCSSSTLIRRTSIIRPTVMDAGL